MPEMEVKLEPCPFCGSSGFLDVTWTTLGFGVVICSKCEAEGPHTASNHICDAQKAESITLWNTRTPSPRIARLEGALRAAVPEDEGDWIEGSDVGSWCFFCRASNEDMYKIVHRDDCAGRAAVAALKGEE